MKKTSKSAAARNSSTSVLPVLPEHFCSWDTAFEEVARYPEAAGRPWKITDPFKAQDVKKVLSLHFPWMHDLDDVLGYHEDEVSCLFLLKDGRFAYMLFGYDEYGLSWHSPVGLSITAPTMASLAAAMHREAKILLGITNN